MNLKKLALAAHEKAVQEAKPAQDAKRERSEEQQRKRIEHCIRQTLGDQYADAYDPFTVEYSPDHMHQKPVFWLEGLKFETTEATAGFSLRLLRECEVTGKEFATSIQDLKDLGEALASPSVSPHAPKPQLKEVYEPIDLDELGEKARRKAEESGEPLFLILFYIAECIRESADIIGYSGSPEEFRIVEPQENQQ